MALADKDRIPTGISIAQAYSKIRDWYKENVFRVASRGDEYGRNSAALISALPTPRETTELEQRAIFREVMTGLLEWAYTESDSEFQMADYVRGATQAAGVDWRLTEDEERELRRTPLWPLLTPGLMESQNDAETGHNGTTPTTSNQQTQQSRPNPAGIQQLEDELIAALSIEDESVRVNKLLELAPSLAPEPLDRVLVSTNYLHDASLRSFAIANLAPYLNEEQLNRAVSFASRSNDLAQRNFALGSLGPFLSEENRANVIDTIRSTPIDQDRLRGWVGLAPYLTSDLKQEAISAALIDTAGEA